MSDLVWSKELPTITGWYWVKENKELPPVCSFICRAAAKGHMLIELNNPNCSPNLKGWSSHYPDILFAGPIKEPMTQEEATLNRLKKLTEEELDRIFYWYS